MPMSMTLKFRNLAQFFFMEWQSNDALGLILGCFCCMLLSFIMLAMPQIRRRVLKLLESSSVSEGSIITDKEDKLLGEKEMNIKQRIVSVLVYVLHAFLHVVIMVIIMNMNFWVILFVIIGATLGYLATSQDYCPKKDNHQCCANKIGFQKGELVEDTDRH